MKILITGSSGLVGSALNSALALRGHEVIFLSRGNVCNGSPVWNPETEFIDIPDSDSIDVVVHLAGENIAEGRWNDKKKKRILSSRVNGTRILSQHFSGVENKPNLFISASAVGIYGDRGDEVLDEGSAVGSGFLPDVCRQWEKATAVAVEAGIRVVKLRLGVVLSREGGALVKMVFPFRMGLGGVVGDGNQFMSWVSIDDVTGSILYLIGDDSIAGAVNLVSPQAVTNREFTKVLGGVLNRPTFLPIPAFVAKLALGEMADSLFLASSHVTPRKLLASDYEFESPDLRKALQSILFPG
ncbi:TIGR01777 family oxidoreductase [bacterium]|nr:TIGR01777 family oxidoreductase [bacterium]